MLSVCHPQILHNHCFQFLLGPNCRFQSLQKAIRQIRNWRELKPSALEGGDFAYESGGDARRPA